MRERGEKCISDLYIPDLFDLSVFCCHEFIYLYVELRVVSSIKGKQTAFYSILDSLKRTADFRIRETWVIGVRVLALPLNSCVT